VLAGQLHRIRKLQLIAETQTKTKKPNPENKEQHQKPEKDSRMMGRRCVFAAMRPAADGVGWGTAPGLQAIKTFNAVAWTRAGASASRST
jgi:hypothetical protein